MPGSCPRGGTLVARGIKNFSVGMCDGAPSTAPSSFVLVFSNIHTCIYTIRIAWSIVYLRGHRSDLQIEQSLYNTIFGPIGMHHVVSELCYNLNILQRNYRKMTFSYNSLSFVKFHIKNKLGPQHAQVITKSVLR